MQRRSLITRLLQSAGVFLVFVQGALISPAQAGPRVEPPDAMVAGKSIGEWTGDWWRFAASTVDFPFPTDVSQAGALGNTKGPVFFAVASPGPGSTTYTYAVPRGKHVLLPLYTYSWAVQTFSDPCSTVHCARKLADSFVHGTRSMRVSIDGEPVRDLFQHYAATPDFAFACCVPVTGWWAGGDPTVAGPWYIFSSGYWLMLEPLSAGKHVISIMVDAPYSAVCADGSQSCDIPSPGPPEVSATTLILTVACDAADRCQEGSQ